jgi:carboxyl-terminal processing protease
MKKISTVFLLLSILSFSFTTSWAADKSEQETQAGLKKFSAIISDIQKYYVYPETKQSLFNDAFRGMLNGLDPHSAYLDENDWRDLQETASGKFAGIGLEVTMKHGLVTVISPLNGSPAQAAGIKPKDTLIRLNGTPLVGLTLRMAIDKLRGPENTKITLDVMRKGLSKPLHLVLTRKIIKIESVKSELLNNKYGYISISMFQDSTLKEMNTAIQSLKKEVKQKNKSTLQGIILDLRDNPGGLMDSAVDVANDFLDGKKKKTLIVYTKGRGPWAEFSAYATSQDLLNHIPMVVLVNEGTASGGEIVAGALKDNHRALLLGTQTFGKGSVQMVIPVDQDSAIRLTTALYYTPNGVSIQARGITPDITVDQISLNSSAFVQNAIQWNNLSEGDLQGHLKSATPEKNQPGNSQNNDSLMEHDYQLYQALNILKGMILTGEMHG